jgi:hypothetical protein
MSDAGLLYKSVGYSLSAILSNIELGDIGLPEIQRPFVWKNGNVRDLFDSMYQGFPVGFLLLWENDNASHSRRIGTETKSHNTSKVIVDGQQRLTSLYAVVKNKKVLRDDFSEEHIEIAFHPLEEKFEVADAAIRKDRNWIPNISKIWESDTNLFKFVGDYLQQLSEVRTVSTSDQQKIQNSIQKLLGLQNYPFQALEILSSASEEQVSQVFVRINSKGKRLNESDFILTLMSVYWDKGRHELEKFSRDCKKPSKTPANSPFNHFIEPSPDQLLRAAIGYGFKRGRLQYVYSLLRGKDLETGVFSVESRQKQFERLLQSQNLALNLNNWKGFLQCLICAGYLNGKLITSQTTIIYSYVFYLLGKYEYKIPDHDLRRNIARWFFFTSLTGRYTNSPESALESDLIHLREVKDSKGFVAFLDRCIKARLTDDFWNVTLPNQLNTAAARSPSQMAYFASLCLLDAKVLFSTMLVAKLLDPSMDAHRHSLERHHLFPKDWLKQKGVTEIYQTNQIANFALIEWPDNSKISNQPPHKYWEEFQNRHSHEEWKSILYWHALPEDWTSLGYEEFLSQRRSRIASVVRNGFDRI